MAASKQVPKVPNKKPLTPTPRAPVDVHHPKIEKQPAVKNAGKAPKPHGGQGSVVVTSGRRREK
jgi:hypothetical protein